MRLEVQGSSAIHPCGRASFRGCTHSVAQCRKLPRFLSQLSLSGAQPGIFCRLSQITGHFLPLAGRLVPFGVSSWKFCANLRRSGTEIRTTSYNVEQSFDPCRTVTRRSVSSGKPRSFAQFRKKSESRRAISKYFCANPRTHVQLPPACSATYARFSGSPQLFGAILLKFGSSFARLAKNFRKIPEKIPRDSGQLFRDFRPIFARVLNHFREAPKNFPTAAINFRISPARFRAIPGRLRTRTGNFRMLPNVSAHCPRHFPRNFWATREKFPNAARTISEKKRPVPRGKLADLRTTSDQSPSVSREGQTKVCG